MSKSIPPPEFSESLSWTDYKKEIKIWQALTTLDAKKQGPCLYLSLTGKAREAALELDIDNIKGENGVELILKRLDELYLEDTTQTAYLAYQNFETFKRPETMKMKDYLVKFEQLYTKIKDHKMELPDGVLAYRVLNSANLTNEQMTLCRATMTDLKYDEMSKQLKRLFADAITSAPGAQAMPVQPKDEHIFYNENNDTNSAVFYGDSRRRSWYHGSGSRRRGNYNSQVKKGGSDEKGILNPLDKDGNISRCRICDSKYHWQNVCPVRSKTPDKITLFQSNNIENEETKIFVGETLNCAVLDSACSQTVCGENWLKCFQESLDDGAQITKRASNSTFQFGNGGPVQSMKKVVLPVTIGKHEVNLETDVVHTDIPLLLSKNAMKKASTVIDFDKDTAVIFGEEHKLIKTTSGHYAIPLTDKRKFVEDNPQEEVKAVFSCIGDAPSKNDIIKLHRQFGHCHESRLMKLIESSNIWSDTEQVSKMVKDVSENCDICKRYKKRSLRPIVSIPLASEFNQTVAMDLITYEQGIWILHLIDLFSRYSVACVRRSKKQDVMIDAIMKTWISYFGQPKRFLADNGGEFLNEDYREMCEMFNIEESKTAAESPWSNGVCERHNAIIKESVRKTMEDSNCNLETAVVWAVSAKNSLSGHQGYSPNMLVFGKNTNFPNVLTNELPALETKVSSVTVENNLKAMNNARKAFIESESSEKIKRALKHKVRSCNDAIFENGDKVYYKRNINPKWRGPGCVIGQENKNILVKHGGELIRVHPASLIHVNEAKPTPPEDVHQKIGEKESIPLAQKVESPTQRVELLEEDENEDVAQVQNPTQNEDDTSGGDEIQPENEASNSVTEITQDSQKEISNDNIEINGQPNIHLPPVKSRIAYKLKSSENLTEGVVHSRAGKATGKYRYHLNIQSPKSNEVEVLDFSTDIAEWYPITEEVMIAYNKNLDSIEAAKEKELKNWKDNNVYCEVEDKDQHTISCRWVIETKPVDGINVTKARLVARGFEDVEASNRRKDSPTCAKESLRITFALIASAMWDCKSMDIRRAFLQGNSLDREIFVKPPKEANTKNIWKLNKCVYGLNEASRYWYNRVYEEFLNIGLMKCDYDDALFYYKPNRKEPCEGIIVIHVDDFLYGGSQKFKKKIEEIQEKFIVGSNFDAPFKYVGLDVNRNEKSIIVEQSSYINRIEESDMKNRNDKFKPLEKHEQREYRAICGQLNWVASQTRPDLSFEVCRLSTSLNSATVDDLMQANKAVRKCKQRSVSIKFPQLQKPLHLVAFCDASYANLRDGSSQGGIIVFLKGKNGKVAPLSWASRKIRRVCRSTLTAETLALLEVSETCFWLSNIINELLNDTLETTEIFTDNKSLYEAAHSTTAVEEKRLRVDIAAIRQSITRKEFVLKWIETKLQLADTLTKQGADATKLLETLKSSQC